MFLTAALKFSFLATGLGTKIYITDIISEDPANHGSTFVPLIVGSDKTTVSVTTGHTEYHPLYLSIGNNIFNSVRHAHCNGVVLVGFLDYPRKNIYKTVDFCNYHWQLFGLGPYIADYPEQVLLSGIVTGWCLKYLNNCKDLNGEGLSLLQCREHTDLLIEELNRMKLWIQIRDFPRGDIHELLSPDLLHQIIKDTFKDHLVTWVEQYLEHTHGALCAAEILDDIDRKITSIAPFAGLCHFPEGCRFNQWTGNNSKVLMKVYLPAIRGHVPQDVICTFNALTEDDLTQLQDALDHFHQYCEVFKTMGVIPTFSLPHQHSLKYYLLMIQRFGAPNGLCSSITESKHIKAVKEPWHRSSRYKALGMLQGSCMSDAFRALRQVSGGARDISDLALELGLPNFPTILQQFLYDQLHITDPDPPIFDPATAPAFMG
ncbi:hypothetical protein DFJ58DRAFT_718665 [Suillus subalutaceus]|uniref:uncharacterized protein n=1 Tax=Suillus subalutaceus TaxID=48586 RepID=UPI001B85CF17|nr:uncharacterized protein DFJ58DRAFT_718665 [Suillus subalutaceus]KAG1838854.1 hypothetical protein DFJ58DRAFT_718665 [Suillus subalutaceus]